MDIIFARHGNTFSPGERVVFIGANEDVPLVARGEEQAHRLAGALGASGILPAAVYCAPLQRTRRYAGIVAEVLALGSPPFTDPRLTEIDYGDWIGLTNEEIGKNPVQKENLRRWDDEMTWPRDANWGGSEEKLRAGLKGFLDDIHRGFRAGDIVLVVTSSGILRYFALMALGVDAPRNPHFPFKMRTGNIGKIRETGDAYEIPYWDTAPGAVPI